MAEELAAAASATGRRLRVHLFVNTGMGRNGVEPSQALNLLRRVDTLESLEMVGFASHFATSDEPGNPFTAAQLEIFETTLREALAEGFTFRDIHIANSGGILNFGASRYTMVRPGLALYGFHPTPELQTESDLRPVMTLRTIVGNVTLMPAGVSISYGRRYHTTAETLIGTLPIGYADGFMRILTNNAEVVIGGRRYPVVGTVCMDEVMVDLGPGSNVRPGDEAIVMGTQGTETISGWELARRAQTIPYEICSNVSKRVPRVAHE
jgi:alanine racemase